jgi:hypothetical protein
MTLTSDGQAPAGDVHPRSRGWSRVAENESSEIREPDFTRVEQQAASLHEDIPAGGNGRDTRGEATGPSDEAAGGSSDVPDRTATEKVGDVVRNHPVAGAVGALTGAATGTILGGAPGTIVGAATGAARGVVVAEAVQKVTERLEDVNLLEPGEDGVADAV